MIVWGQYLSYLAAGGFYYLMLAAFFSVAAGFSTWAVVLVLLALVLGGYASGMSFVLPRIAAVLGGTAALIFFVYCVSLIFSETCEVGSVLVAIPAVVAVAISVAALQAQRGPLWLRQQGTMARTGLGILIAVPALLATYIALYMMTKLFL